MGLFDIVKEKVSELLSGAGEKVDELTGTDVSDQLTQSADTVTDKAQDVVGSTSEAADSAISDVTGQETGAPDQEK